MSKKSIDQRVVEMRFENQQFEHGAKETMTTLDKLKEKLRIGTGKDAGMDELNNSINGIKAGFSAMSEVAIGALRHIGEKAIDVGIQMTKALTIEPVMDGFSEYQNKMNSIQTILTNTKSKGTTIEDVTKALDELNEYADLTVYSFADMTKAIGQFTTAGIGLEDAVAAIKGFSNLAAGVGVNNAALTGAEVQLSQALSTGKMLLQDWKSMEARGFGGEYFQKALIEAGKQIHQNEESYMQWIEAVEKGQKSFRDSIMGKNIHVDWVNNDVLMLALKKFADDPTLVEAATKVRTITQLFDTLKEAIGTGWATSLETIIGNYEEASDVLTKINNALSDIISGSNKARNEMLQEWKDLGGRDDLIASMKNMWEALLSIAKPIKEAFTDIFPPLTGKTLAELTAKFKEFTAGLKLSDGAAEKLKNVVKALLTPVKLVFEALKGGTNVLTPFITVMGKVGSKVIELIATLFKFPESFVKTIGNEKYAKLVDGLSKAFENLWNIVKSVGTGIAGGFSKIFDALNIDLSSEKLSQYANAISDKLIGLFDKLSHLKLPDNIFKSVGESFEDLVRKFKSIKLDAEDFPGKLKQAFESLDVLNKIKAADTFDNATNKISGFFKVIMDFVSNLHVMENLGAALEYLGEAFGKFVAQLDTGRAVALAYGASLSLFLVKLSSLLGSFTNIAKNVSKLTKSASNAMQAWANEKNANALLKFAGAVAILAGSIIALSLVDDVNKLKEAEKAIAIISGIAAAFFILLSVLGKNKEKDTDIKSLLDPISAGINSFLEDAGKALKRASLLAFSAGVLILVMSMGKLIDAIEQIKKLDVQSIHDNLEAYAIVVGSLISIALLGQKGGFGTFGLALGIGGLILLVNQLVKLAKDLSKPKINFKGAALTLGGLVVITKSLGTLMEASKYTTGKMMGFGGGMVLAAAGIAILIQAAKSISDLEGWDYAQAALVVGGVMFLLSELMNASSLTAGSKAGTIMAIGVAVAALAGSLAVLSLIDPGPLVTAAIALGGVMVALGLLIKGMESVKMTGFIDALKVLIPALGMLASVTAALAILSGYNWDSLLASAGSIGGVLLALVESVRILSTVQTVSVVAVATAAALTGITYALSAIIKWLAEVPADRALASATSLSELLVALAASVKLLSTVDKVTVAAVATAGALTGITWALSAIIKWLAEVPAESAKASALALGGLLLALVGSDGAITLISKVQGDLVSALSTLGTLTLVTGALGAIIKWVAESNAASALNAAESLSMLLLSLSASCVLLGTVGLLGDKAFEGVAVLDALIVSILNIIGVVAAIGEAVDRLGGEGKFVEVITRVGDAIGSFFGAIQGSFYSESFSRISETMDLEPLQKIFDFIKSFDDEVYDNLRKFAEALEVTVTNGLITNLSAFGDAMSDFSEKLSGMDQNVVMNSQNAVKAVACFATTEVDYGLIKKSAFVSSEFNDALVYFGSHFKSYANHIKNVDSAIVTQSTNAARSVKLFFENIPQNNSMLKKIADGGSQLSNIGNELKKFGSSFKSYANFMSKIDVGGLNKTTNALKKLLDVIGDGKEVKTDSISNGLNVVKGLIKGLADGTESIRKASKKVARESINAMKDELDIHSPSGKGQEISNYTIDGLIKPFEERGGEYANTVSKFVGNGISGIITKTIEQTTAQYNEVINKCNEQYEQAGASIDEYMAKGIIDNSGSVVGAFGTLSQNGIDVVSNYKQEFTNEYANMMKDMQEEAQKSYGGLSEQQKQYFDEYFNTLNSYGEPSYQAGVEIGTQTGNGIVSSYPNVRQAVIEIGEQSVQTFYPYSDEFRNQGLETGQKISDAFREKVPEIKQSVNEFGEGMHTSLELYRGKLEKTARTTCDSFVEMLDRLDTKNKERINKIKGTITSELDNERYRNALRVTGVKTVDGFVSGINSVSSKVRSAAEKLAQSVISGIKGKLNIHSPSKETEQIGIFAIDGLVNGLTKFSGRVADASEVVGAATLDSMNDVISRIAEKIDTDVNLDPVIRPVLDLSNVEENAGQLNSMLMSDETFKMANANSAAIRASREYNEINNQNLAIDDTGIISAIDKLHNDIADMSVQLSNMQVIMDSGALVGQLFAPMDAAFGSRIQRNLREREA